MTNATTILSIPLEASIETAWQGVHSSFERFCLTADMALRWTAAGMIEAAKGFRRLKAYKQLPALKAALLAHQAKHLIRNKNRQAA